MDEDMKKDVIRKLQNLEDHVINLIHPIQSITSILKSNDDIKALISIFKQPIQIDDRPFKHNSQIFLDEIKKYSKELKEFDFGKFIESLKDIEKRLIKEETLNQTLAELKYLNKRVLEIEDTLKKIQEKGIDKQVKLSFYCDGYELTEKQINHDPAIPKKLPIDDNAALSGLSKRERHVVIHYLGLQGNKKHTFDAIAKDLFLTRSTVRDVLHKSIRKLRSKDNMDLVKMVGSNKLKEIVLFEE